MHDNMKSPRRAQRATPYITGLGMDRSQKATGLNHSQAFCHIEAEVCDLVRAAQLASEQVFGAIGEQIERDEALAPPDAHAVELAIFAVDQVLEMATRFKAHYYHLYGEPQSTGGTDA
jgi:hypothetical protein